MSCRESRARRSGSLPVYLMPSRAGAAWSALGASCGFEDDHGTLTREIHPCARVDWVRVAASLRHEPTSRRVLEPWIRAAKGALLESVPVGLQSTESTSDDDATKI